jgi:hypothetical protein
MRVSLRYLPICSVAFLFIWSVAARAADLEVRGAHMNSETMWSH